MLATLRTLLLLFVLPCLRSAMPPCLHSSGKRGALGKLCIPPNTDSDETHDPFIQNFQKLCAPLPTVYRYSTCTRTNMPVGIY